MARNNRIYQIAVAAMLCAVGILIPIFSPVKILMEPMSFTLASHVAIFIGMFISPITALAVSLGTTLGFLLYGFPIVVVIRALSHVIFALIGAVILQRHPEIISGSLKKASTIVKLGLFCLLIALIHAVCEVGVVVPFYFGNAMSTAYYAKGFLNSVVLLVGVGTVVHSTVDFIIAVAIWKPLARVLTHR